MSGKDKASAEDLHVMDTVEQYETYEDYLDSQASLNRATTVQYLCPYVRPVLEFARVSGGSRWWGACRDLS